MSRRAEGTAGSRTAPQARRHSPAARHILTSPILDITMPHMRTTLTLDDDVAHQLRERARLTGAPFKQLVNDAIRAGLQTGKQPVATLPPFRVTPKAAGFRSGVDVLRLNQLNDELDSDAFERKMERGSTRR